MSTAPSEAQQHCPLRFWIPLSGIVVLLLVGAAIVLWRGLPRWAPEWTLENSPFVDPAVRALAERAEFEQVEHLPYKCLIPNIEIDPSWPVAEALSGDPLALEPLLRSEDERIRRTAATILRNLHPRGPAFALVAICVESDDATLRTLGFNVLESLPAAIVDSPECSLLASRLLVDPQPRMREATLLLLGDAYYEFGHHAPQPHVESLIVGALLSPFRDVRRRAAKMVAWSGHGGLRERFKRETFGPLVSSLGGGDTRTRQAAADMRKLEMNGEPWGVVLAAVLHAEPDVRMVILSAVEKDYAEGRCDEALEAALYSPEPRLRASAARALWDLSPYPDDGPLANLANLAESEDPVLRAMGIHWRWEENRIDSLTILTALRSKHPVVQRAGVRAMANVVLEEDDLDVLCLALTTVDDPSARELLRVLRIDYAGRDAAWAVQDPTSVPE